MWFLAGFIPLYYIVKEAKEKAILLPSSQLYGGTLVWDMFIFPAVGNVSLKMCPL